MKRVTLFGLLLTLLSAAPAFADTVYTYTGHSYDTATAPFTLSESVSGSLTLSSPLQPGSYGVHVYPTEFSFSNGYFTFTNANSTSYVAAYTDSSGNLIGFVLDFYNGAQNLWSGPGEYNEVDVCDVCALVGYGSGYASQGDVFSTSLGSASAAASEPGVWTISTVDTSATPEPSSLLMLGTSTLAALGVLRRKLLR